MTLPSLPPVVDLMALQQQLADAGIDVSHGIGMLSVDDPSTVHTYDADGDFANLPPEADPIVAAFFAPPSSSKSSSKSTS